MADESVEVAAAARAFPSLLPWQTPVACEALSQPWPPALLIYGPRGIAKHALALNLALALLCEAPQKDGIACGRCASCGYALAGQHPDLMRIELTEFDDESGRYEAVDTIAIDRIRTLIDFVQITSHRGRAKVAVIAPAERMKVQAANALLKTLEEPPAGTYLILVADQPDQLLPTIVSRCRRLAAPLPTPEEAGAWLAQQGIADSGAVLAQTSGAPLLALEFARGDWQSERKVWLSALADPQRLSPLALAARIEGGTRDERRARLDRALDFMLAWSVDLGRAAAGGAPRRNVDYTMPLTQLARRVSALRLFRFYRTLLDHRALLAHPLQARSVAESMLIDYQALFDR